jgi:cell division septation protein DedD
VNEPETPPVQPQKPVKPKLRAEKKPPKTVAAVEEPGAGQDGSFEPLILVPPAQPASQAQNVDPQNIEPQIAQPGQPQPGVGQPQAEAPAVEQKSKSFFSFGSTGKRKLTGKAAERDISQGASGNWVNSPDPNSASAETPDSQQQQIAAVAPEPLPAPEPVQPTTLPPVQPAPQQAKPSSGGFVAQLASFRSEAEAMAEYDRLRAKHGTVLSGLSPRIVKANVAGGSRYRLGVGPLASRSAASKICNSLIAAGERDCLVRGN